MRLLLKYLLFILLPAYTYGQSGRPDAGITFADLDTVTAAAADGFSSTLTHGSTAS